jgi:DNA ligase-associated metallophosphoesterase
MAAQETGQDYAFRFAGAALCARPSGALWWPEQGALLVADLHLGRSDRYARRAGALLPPYEAADTLARLRAEIESTGARDLWVLGDTFDDDKAADPRKLAHLPAQVHLVSGNHDPAQGRAEVCLSGITLRHQATGDNLDISGHYHPKLTIAGRRIPAFLLGRSHLILPAFGTYTGGMDALNPVLTGLVGPGLAILTGRHARAVPYARALARG